MLAHRPLFILVLLLAVPLPPSSAQPGPSSAPLSVEDVVKLSKEGMSEDVIIAKVRKNGKPFDLSSDELVELKKSGVADNVIKFLLDPTQPYVPPAPPAAPAAAPSPPKVSAPARKYPEDPYASRVPPAPGLYRFSRNEPVQIDIKLLLGEKQGAGLGKVLLKKGKIIGYLVGLTSKIRIPETAPVFYIRLPEGKGIEEVLLVALERKNDRRELDMGPSGPKPELKSETMRQFDSLEVGAGLFRLTPGNLGKGEYMFFLIGTAEPPKGNYGKGYDFGVEPPEGEKKKR
jgi:hypothetical protein